MKALETLEKLIDGINPDTGDCTLVDDTDLIAINEMVEQLLSENNSLKEKLKND